MNRTGIEYLDHTWNPIAMRCAKVSDGCRNCWHLSRANMFASNPNFQSEVREAYAGKRSPMLIESRLLEPKRIRTPSIIGVQFMGDWFALNIACRMRESVMEVMRSATQHTFLLLSKQVEYMAIEIQSYVGLHRTFPKNVWIGFSAENQSMFDIRMTHVRKLRELLPDHVIWLSYEPALGPIVLDEIDGSVLDWVALGPETGRNARPCNATDILGFEEQCQGYNIPTFRKLNPDGTRVENSDLQQMPMVAKEQNGQES